MQTIRKFRILRGMVVMTMQEWRDQIWNRDLDEIYCCDGRECGCGAVTVGEVYGENNNPPAAGEGE